MSEMKATMNVRISADMNVSFTFTGVVDDETEARAFGDHCAKITAAWVVGYGEAEVEDAA